MNGGASCYTDIHSVSYCYFTSLLLPTDKTRSPSSVFTSHYLLHPVGFCSVGSHYEVLTKQNHSSLIPQKTKLPYNYTSALITWTTWIGNLREGLLAPGSGRLFPCREEPEGLEGGAQGVQSGCSLPLLSLRGKRKLAILKMLTQDPLVRRPILHPLSQTG